jgi:hypothetical protein
MVWVANTWKDLFEKASHSASSGSGRDYLEHWNRFGVVPAN